MKWPTARLIFLLAAAVPLVLAQAEVWEKPNRFVIVLSLAVIAVTGAAEPFMADWVKSRRLVSEDRRRTVEDVLLAAIPEVSQLTSMRCSSIGIHVFAVHDRRPGMGSTWDWIRRRGPFLPYAELTRVARVRLANWPEPSNIKWRYRTGVVGSCWAHERGLTKDVHALQEPHYDCSADDWEGVPPEVTLHMTFREFELSKRKHGMIVAHPINRTDGEVVGVVAIDGPPGQSSALDSGPVRNLCQRLAGDVQRHLILERSGKRLEK